MAHWDHTMDERSRSVSPTSSIKTHHLNHFSPNMSVWAKPIGLRQPDLVALQARMLSDQGHMAREQMVQAPRVSEQAEQTPRVSLA